MKPESPALFWMFTTVLLGIALVIVALNEFSPEIGAAIADWRLGR